MDIGNLYEDLKKYGEEDAERDDLFYDAPEGDAQIDIAREMLGEILKRLN